jgi:hypothetical protein
VVVGCVSVDCDGRLGHWGLIAVAQSSQGRGVATALVTAADALCRVGGCAAIQLEFFYAENHAYSKRLRDWYRKLGYTPVHYVPIGYQMRRFPTTVPFYFEAAHKPLTGMTSAELSQAKICVAQLQLAALQPSLEATRRELGEVEEALLAPSLHTVPEDILLESVLPLLSLTALLRVSVTCRALRGVVAAQPELWARLAVARSDRRSYGCDRLSPRWCPTGRGSSSWATERQGLLFLSEGVLPAAATANSRDNVAHQKIQVDWRKIFHARSALPNRRSVVVDVGRGYTKYGLLDSTRFIASTSR